MIQHRSGIRHILVSLALIFCTSFASGLFAQDGKKLFQDNCASCHKIDAKLTGPALRGVEDRWPDKAKLHAWIRNSASVIASGDPYAVKLFAEYNKTAMTPFPQFSDADIDAILKYIATAPAPPPPGTKDDATGSGGGNGGSDNSMLFGVISLILFIVTIILMQVNSSLKKLTDEKEGIKSPEPVAFWRNKTYLMGLALLFFVVGGFYISKGAVALGRSKNYQPEQPIYYSHKVHAGVNQINCLYCHGGAQEGKHANIPSVNVCMNCHMGIVEYTGKDKLLREDGSEVNGTAEIQKLHQYAGFTPGQPWDPAKAKSIEWVKIHALPDHVYFNHAQHVNAGKVQCQTCHGEIQNMGEVKQFADLSMGWCVNCHRETKVQFNNDSTGGNKFYSIYEKFHQDLKSGKIDSVTVEMIGGTECQKCHY